MSSLQPGTATSEVEVTHVSSHGVWPLAGVEELFMSYRDLPWFKDAKIATILNVEEPSPGHYFWPDLDIDPTRDIIKHRERFPLQVHHTPQS